MAESHTATEQWQSFELRMRQRRFERCLVRAEAALDADVLDAAKEALEEAQHLSPNDPRLPDLVARLAIAETPLSVAPIEPDIVVLRQPPSSHRWMWVASAIALSAVAGWFAGGGRVTIPQFAFNAAPQSSEPRRVTPPSAEPTPSPASATPAATEPSRETEPSPAAVTDSALSVPAAEKPPPVTPQPAGTIGSEQPKPPIADAGLNAPPIASTSPERGTVELRSDATPTNKPAPLTAPVGSPVTVSPVVADPPGQPAAVLPDLPPSALPAPTPVTVPDTTAARSTTTTNAPTASAPVADAAVTDERLVRAALSLYAAAYNRLDAAAARAVWPSVDQRALARAFDGLVAQNIALGQCDVHVNGATAHAECAGNAKWTPKVGGGSQSAARRWRFDLRNTGGDWIIVQANVR